MNSLLENRPPERSKLKKWGQITLGVLVVSFVGIQFVPVAAMENPASQPPLQEPPEVVAILKRACYDCHSHEVRWPWYSRIAPVSWLVARDVVEGRKGINFSEWPEDEEDRAFSREQTWDSVESGEMPLWFYLPVHPEANLTEADKAVLKKWSETEVEEEEEDEEEEEEKDEAAPAKSAAEGAGKPPDKAAEDGADEE
jgi:Haem-binding domain